MPTSKPTNTPLDKSPDKSPDDGAYAGELANIINQLPSQTPPEVVRIITEKWGYSGIAPTPTWVEHYERIVPGYSSRILDLAEREQKNRHAGNMGYLLNDRLKVTASAFVSVTLICAGVTCVFLGHPAAGVAIATSGAIAGLVQSFTGSNKRDDKAE